jgi:predicted phage gp36 major capsid-like protein
VAKWREDLSAAQEVLQRLHNRLEHVRELRDGMATHGPRLQELAAERLRHQKPHLVDAWEELQEAHRLGLLALRARAQSIRQTQTGGMRLGLVVE